MDLNAQIMDAFRSSRNFMNVVSLFEGDKHFYEWAFCIYSFAKERHSEYMHPAEMAKESAYFDSWISRNTGPSLFAPCNIRLWYEFERFVDQLQESTGKSFRDLNSMMDAISLALYRRCPFFKPLIYPYRYDVFSKSCEALGISLPEAPVTKNYRNYFFFYYDICLALDKYQADNGLSPAELCALIYYAMDVQTQYSLELPSPTNVWLIGGDRGDLTRLEATEDQLPTIWQGNEMTRKGDIVIMYVLSPLSAIHSVWRTITESFFNPFDRYQHRIVISRGIKVPSITIGELRSDPYFRNLSIVRKNMQGINGVSLSFADYNELMNRWEQKGLRRDKLPSLMIPEELDVEINKEEDVENDILIPALKKLGYFDGDWERQLKLKKGRTESEIPDFVVFPRGEHLHQTAPLIIEVKLDFKNGRQFRKDFSQGYSYAQSLHSKYLGLCDRHRLVVYAGQEGTFNVDSPIFEAQWTEIFSKETVFSKLKQIIGREIVKDIKIR